MKNIIDEQPENVNNENTPELKPAEPVKKQNDNTGLIIAGIVALLIIGGIMLNNYLTRNQKENENID